jgi:hypothetical protein
MALDFELAPEQVLIQKVVGDIVARFEPHQAEFRRLMHEERRYPQELWDALAEVGLQGSLNPPDHAPRPREDGVLDGDHPARNATRARRGAPPRTGQPGRSVEGHTPGTGTASSGPGQGGIVTATAARSPGPSVRNWKCVPSGIVRHVPGSRGTTLSRSP